MTVGPQTDNANVLSLSEFCRVYDIPLDALHASIDAGYFTARHGFVLRDGKPCIAIVTFEERYALRHRSARKGRNPGRKGAAPKSSRGQR